MGTVPLRRPGTDVAGIGANQDTVAARSARRDSANKDELSEERATILSGVGQALHRCSADRLSGLSLCRSIPPHPIECCQPGQADMPWRVWLSAGLGREATANALFKDKELRLEVRHWSTQLLNL